MFKIRKSLLDRQKKEERSELCDLAFFALILVLCVFVVWTRFYWLVCMEVSGSSMFGTLENGDYVLVDRLSPYTRGDVIVFTTDEFSTDKEKTPISYIKRVIAVEGDVLKVQNGEVWLKKCGETTFEKLIEPYARGETIRKGHLFLSVEGEEITISQGCVFVMGDNRTVSRDSRSFGEVKIEYIDGVVSQAVIDNKDGVWGKFYKYL